VFKECDLILRPGDPSRILKIRAFRERIALPLDEKVMPKLVVYSTCKDFIRLMPALAMDTDNPEDIDTDQIDHIYDEACHIVMLRAHGLSTKAIQIKEEAKAREKTLAKIPVSHQTVWHELDDIRRRLEEIENG
jgi:hypothetical protein